MVPLEYRSPRAGRRRGPWTRAFAGLLLAGGVGVALLGLLLGGVALLNFHASRTTPGWSWGPNNYLRSMMVGFAWDAAVMIPAGVVGVIAGRRLWRGTGPAHNQPLQNIVREFERTPGEPARLPARSGRRLSGASGPGDAPSLAARSVRIARRV